MADDPITTPEAVETTTPALVPDDIAAELERTRLALTAAN